jgi:hypothetical protein
LKTIGFMLQGLFFVLIWAIPLFVLGSLSDPNNPNPIISILFLTFFGLTVFAGVGIIQSLYVSISALGRGEHISLKQAWFKLEGLKVKFGFYMLVVYMGLLVVSALLSSLMTTLGLVESFPRFSNALVFCFLNFLTALSTFIFMGMADLIAKKQNTPS